MEQPVHYGTKIKDLQTEIDTMKTQKVSITDVEMPLMSMVVLILKWTAASIPAMIVLFVLVAVLTGLGGMITGLFR